MLNTVRYYEQRIKGCEFRRCQRCQILYCTMNKGSKAMYVEGVESDFCSFMQHCIQSNGTHVRGVESVLYSVYMAPCPSKMEGLYSLPSCGFSGSPIQGGSFVLTFWDLSNYKGSWRQDAQPTPNS